MSRNKVLGIILLVLSSLVIGLILGIFVIKRPTDSTVTTDVTSTDSSDSTTIETTDTGITADKIANVQISVYQGHRYEFDNYEYLDFSMYKVADSTSADHPDNADYVAKSFASQQLQRESFITKDAGIKILQSIWDYCQKIDHSGEADEYGIVSYERDYVGSVSFYYIDASGLNSRCEYLLTRGEFDDLYSQLADFVSHLEIIEDDYIILADYSNMDYVDAQTSLEALGFGVILMPDSTSDFDSNKVTRTVPPQGSKVTTDQPITVYYAVK